MGTFAAYKKSNRLTTLLTVLISLTFMIAWLPFLRSVLDGRSYQWGINYFGFQLHGAGITPDFVFLVLQLALFAGLFIAMYRVRNRLVYYVLLAVWFFHTFGNLLADIIVNGDSVFEGDTLGVKVSLTWIVVPLSVLALSLIFMEIRADRRAAPQEIPWVAKNRNLLWLILLGPLPVQAVLLATGKPHGLTDQIGVVMTILQSFLIPVILRPYPGKTRVGEN